MGRERIDLETWEPIHSDYARAGSLRRVARDEERTVLGFFGHIKHKKGGEYFTRALKRSGLSGRSSLLIDFERWSRRSSERSPPMKSFTFTLTPSLTAMS